jgi:hypothetical protein
MAHETKLVVVGCCVQQQFLLVRFSFTSSSLANTADHFIFGFFLILFLIYQSTNMSF